MTDKTGLFRSETEWYNYAPKLDSIRFEFETSPWFAGEKAKRIDGLMYYFRMNESNFEFGSIKLSESLSCIYGQCFLTFNRFSSLSTNENHVFGFKISIEIQFENHTMIKFQLNPLGCQEFNCTGYGECYADYRLGKAARCRCYRGHFGEHCQHHDPCLKVGFITSSTPLMILMLLFVTNSGKVILSKAIERSSGNKSVYSDQFILF